MIPTVVTLALELVIPFKALDDFMLQFFAHGLLQAIGSRARPMGRAGWQ
ncbi:hypothetical protein [Lysobacter gummosus]